MNEQSWSNEAYLVVIRGDSSDNKMIIIHQ